MNTSFGAEDGLQQLHMVADDSRYESASICEATRACSELRMVSSSLIMHELGNALDREKSNG